MNLRVFVLKSFLQQNQASEIFDKTWVLDNCTEVTPNLLQVMSYSGSNLYGRTKFKPSFHIIWAHATNLLSLQFRKSFY